MKNKLLCLIPILALLAGCASDSKRLVDLHLHYVPTSQLPANSQAQPDGPMLLEAANSVNNSLDELSQIQMALHPKAKMPAPVNPDNIGMGQQVSIDWDGPMLTMVKSIAKASQYHVKTLGNQPAIVPLVSIHMHDQLLADVLRNLEYQVVNHVRIQVYPKTRIIEVRYLHK